jgi:nucleoside-diphosphate-sugar epimerase
MILLTGATGSAGSFIANEFVRERVPVRILVRNRAKATGFEKVPAVEIVEGDMATCGHFLMARSSSAWLGLARSHGMHRAGEAERHAPEHRKTKMDQAACEI